MPGICIYIYIYWDLRWPLCRGATVFSRNYLQIFQKLLGTIGKNMGTIGESLGDYLYPQTLIFDGFGIPD